MKNDLSLVRIGFADGMERRQLMVHNQYARTIRTGTFLVCN